MSGQTPNTPAPDAPAPNPAFQQPPAGPGENREKPAAPAPPPTVPLTVDEYNRLRGLETQLSQFQAEKQAAIDAKEKERIQALADAGKVKEALEAREKWFAEKQAEAAKKHSELETQYFGEKINAALYEATSGLSFASDHAAGMCRQLLRDQLEARREADGSIKVIDKASGRPAADVLRERLSDESLAFFFKPTTRGGSGSDGARHPAPPQQPPQPGSLDAIADAWKAGQTEGFGLDRTG